MGANRNPFLRYRHLHTCLSSKYKRYWSPDELLDKLAQHDHSIQLRQLKSDLEAMRTDERLGYLAPIVYCRKNKGYYYTDPDYSIHAIPLTEEDFRALMFATNILQQYMGVSMVQQFEGAIDKVIKVVKQLQTDSVSTSQSVIAFEKAPYYKGMDHFDRIHDAICNQQPLTIVYRKFLSDKDDTHTFHPYFLKEYRNRWYVLGYSKERHFTIPLGLDRIESIQDSVVPYRPNKTINPESYFKHTLGITLGKGQVEEIRLWFSPQQASYIKTRHMHHSQLMVSDDDNGLVITLQLIPNYELMQEILSYGAEAKVLYPLSLQEKVKDILRKGHELYGIN